LTENAEMGFNVNLRWLLLFALQELGMAEKVKGIAIPV